jgi:cyclic nucleotide gated channel
MRVLVQVMIWVITPRLIAKGGDTTKVMTFILISFLVQYLPKLVHSALLVRRLQRVTGYVFGTAASGFFLNLITYFICAHVRKLNG